MFERIRKFGNRIFNDRTKEVGQEIYDKAMIPLNYSENFFKGLIAPGLFAFISKFLWGHMQPHNDKKIPRIQDDPITVHMFIAGSIACGGLNVYLQWRLEKKNQYLKRLRDDLGFLNEKLKEYEQESARITFENLVLASILEEQPESVQRIIDKLSKGKAVDCTVDHEPPNFDKHEKPAFDEVKYRTREAKAYLLHKAHTAIFACGSVAMGAIGECGIPMAVLLSFNALVEDLHELPIGMALEWATIVAAGIQGLRGTYRSVNLLRSQKNDEDTALTSIRETGMKCVDEVVNLEALTIRNNRLRKMVRESVGYSGEVKSMSFFSDNHRNDMQHIQDVAIRSQRVIEESENDPLLEEPMVPEIEGLQTFVYSQIA